jgi:hypothetical protein
VLLKSGYLKIILGWRELDVGKIEDFHIIADLWQIYPHGWISVKDADGKIWSEFEGLAIGTPILIEIVSEPEDPTGESKEKIAFPQFFVTKVQLNADTDSSTYAGIIKIYFSHPWELMKDVTNHAYEQMNGTELIKKVLRDETRGFTFEINDTNFDKTDDPGKTSRFKTNETDFDFLMNKVLPYCTIDQSPAHLYCDEFGIWWLKSFKKLFKENGKIVIGPKEADLSLQDVAEQIQKNIDNFGIDSTDLVSVIDSSLLIGGREITNEFYPAFIIENASSGLSVSGGKRPGNKLKERNGQSFGNLLPIDTGLMMKTTGTRTKLVMNRALLDAVTTMFSGSDILDNTIRLRIGTYFVGQKCNLGNTVEVVVPKVVYEDGQNKEKGKYLNWVAGKWLVTRIEHYIGETNKQDLLSILYLSRPSFVGSEKTTSLLRVGGFYESV